MARTPAPGSTWPYDERLGYAPYRAPGAYEGDLARAAERRERTLNPSNPWAFDSLGEVPCESRHCVTSFDIYERPRYNPKQQRMCDGCLAAGRDYDHPVKLRKFVQGLPAHLRDQISDNLDEDPQTRPLLNQMWYESRMGMRPRVGFVPMAGELHARGDAPYAGQGSYNPTRRVYTKQQQRAFKQRAEWRKKYLAKLSPYDRVTMHHRWRARHDKKTGRQSFPIYYGSWDSIYK